MSGARARPSTALLKGMATFSVQCNNRERLEKLSERKNFIASQTNATVNKVKHIDEASRCGHNESKHITAEIKARKGVKIRQKNDEK